MSVRQLSVFLENKPGTLNELTKVMADNKINIRALSLSETDGFGIARIITDDVYEAGTILRDAGYISKTIPVVLVAIPDIGGSLNTVLDIFTESQINVAYMYSTLGGLNGANGAVMIFKVSDPKKAERVLREHDMAIIDQDQISDLF